VQPKLVAGGNIFDWPILNNEQEEAFPPPVLVAQSVAATLVAPCGERALS